MNINRVNLSGNLTRDPEVRSTQSGMNILNFGIAVNDRRRNNQTGEWEDYANFFDCVLFGNRAEWLARDLHKGKKVYLEGRLRYSTWERDGQRRSKVEIIVDDVDYDRPPRQQGGFSQQGGYNNGQQSGGYNSQQQQPQASQSAPAGNFTAAAPQQQYYSQQQAPAPQPPAATMPPQSDNYDEDIPF